MKDSLARKLLTRAIDWPTDRLTAERHDLHLLADYKYDEYQQFAPGMRFMESLVLWLTRFESPEEKNAAYDLFKKNLIFISAKEIEHLIQMTYMDTIRPYLIRHVAKKHQFDEFAVKKIVNSNHFEIAQRKCLFLGLSDGAKLDLFRRFSTSLKHEQIYPTYLITEDKARELSKELNRDIGNLTGKPANEKYELIFLIDDFTASGTSYIREECGCHAGKIAKFLKQVISDDECDVHTQVHDSSRHESSNPPHILRLKTRGSNGVQCDFIAETIDKKNLMICVVLYVATTSAIQRIKDRISKHIAHTSIKVEVYAVQELDDSVRLNSEDLERLEGVLKNNFQYDDIVTPEYKKGRHDNPHHGFDSGCLSLVLNHNCPNNSLPVLWYENEAKGIPALFPRVQRYNGD